MRLPAWPLTAEVRHNLFLAFKEALHNVVKHAKASEVRVSLALEPNAFALAVADNGTGFVPAGQGTEPQLSPDRTAPGNGLANMRRRLEEVGGHCDIRSAPGAGTKVELGLPLKPQAA
jgi:signal transduction histidine kinase